MEKQKEIAKKLLDTGMSIEQVSKITGLSKKNIKNL
jgi:transposase